MRNAFLALPLILLAAPLLAQTAVPPAASAPASVPPVLAAPPPPPAPKITDFETVADVIARYPEYATLNRAIAAAGLSDALEAQGPFTILAPTEGAFAKLPKGGLDKILDAKANPALADRLKFHVIPGYLSPADLRRQLKAKGSSQIPTLAGETLVARIELDDTISIVDSTGKVAKIAGGERSAFNGLVLPIDAVESPKPTPKPKKTRG